jgi:hypothetical protein
MQQMVHKMAGIVDFVEASGGMIILLQLLLTDAEPSVQL